MASSICVLVHILNQSSRHQMSWHRKSSRGMEEKFSEYWLMYLRVTDSSITNDPMCDCGLDLPNCNIYYMHMFSVQSIWLNMRFIYRVMRLCISQFGNPGRILYQFFFLKDYYLLFFLKKSRHDEHMKDRAGGNNKYLIWDLLVVGLSKILSLNLKSCRSEIYDLCVSFYESH